MFQSLHAIAPPETCAASSNPEEDADFVVEPISLQGVLDVDIEDASIGNEFRVFDRAFVIDGDVPDTAMGKLVTASVVAFNLGIVFHLLGLPSDCQYLSKSVSMYSKAAQLLSQYQLKGSQLQELEMALYCNLGHIHSITLNEAGTRWCRQELHKRFDALDIPDMCEESAEFFQDVVRLPYAGRLDQAPAA